MTPQARTVLKHLKEAGEITQREALMTYSVQCLTKRIQELRDYGYRIDTEHRKHPTTKQRYAKYVLH